jgi:YVTN family beta-propeller protein
MTVRATAVLVAAAVALAGCDGAGDGGGGSASTAPAKTIAAKKPKLHPLKKLRGGRHRYRVPPLLDKKDVYAADAPNRLSRVVRKFRPLIYVPNSLSDSVDVIDPRTYKIVRHFPVGGQPQHVVPSYDLKTLWVNNNTGNSLTPINPRNGKPGKPVPVIDPYNLYFTPDGKYAIVMAERLKRIDFRTPHKMKLRHSLSVPTCPGVNHADFTANGRLMLASCEFGGRMIVVDVPKQKVVKTIDLKSGAGPQDVKLSPDGRVFYVADMLTNGVWKIDARTFKKIGFVHTGLGAHGLYVSRDSRYLYVSNRRDSSISLISLRKRKEVKKWRIPGGATPDMGGVSTNGRVLWLAGRYSGEVYALSTRTGKLKARIKVGQGPHGLCVYPQPGRYSLGHTGVFR